METPVKKEGPSPQARAKGNRAMRMKKYRRWATEMRAHGFKVIEPEGETTEEK